MSFISTDDLAARFSADYLAQYTPVALAAAVTDANGFAEAYVASAYPLPLVSVAPGLKAACSDIAHRRLFEQDAPDGVQERYTAAVKFLEAVAAKRVTLPGASVPGAAGADSSSLVFYGCAPAQLSRSSLSGF